MQRLQLGSQIMNHISFPFLLRELVKKYEILLIIFFLVFLIFLISEGLLFVSFFWTSFHSLSSPTLRTCPPEGFYLPDPCELTLGCVLQEPIVFSLAFISFKHVSLPNHGSSLERISKKPVVQRSILVMKTLSLSRLLEREMHSR